MFLVSHSKEDRFYFFLNTIFSMAGYFLVSAVPFVYNEEEFLSR